MKKREAIVMGLTFAALTACGDSELYLYRPDAITPDIIVKIEQIKDGAWTAGYEKGARSDRDFYPFGDTIRVRFKANEGGHKLSIPDTGFTLPGVAGQITEGSIVVTKAVVLDVICAEHPEEETDLTLKFQKP